MSDTEQPSSVPVSTLKRERSNLKAAFDDAAKELEKALVGSDISVLRELQDSLTAALVSYSQRHDECCEAVTDEGVKQLWIRELNSDSATTDDLLARSSNLLQRELLHNSDNSDVTSTPSDHTASGDDQLSRADRENAELKQKILQLESQLQGRTLHVTAPTVTSSETSITSSAPALTTQPITQSQTGYPYPYPYPQQSNTAFYPPQPPQNFYQPQQPYIQPPVPATHTQPTGQYLPSNYVYSAPQPYFMPQMHHQNILPAPELLKFDGNPVNYSKFIKNFETHVEHNTRDSGQRLQLLIQHCLGDVRSRMEGYIHEPVEIGYAKAKTALADFYGRPHVIAACYLDKLIKGPQLTSYDYSGLSKFALDMHECDYNMRALGYSAEIDSSDTLRKIVKRLPNFMRNKWVDVADTMCNSGNMPTFTKLLKFVEDRSRISMSVYGQDLAKENDKPKGSDKRSNNAHKSKPQGKVTTLAATATKSTADSSPRQNKCSGCEGDCRHLSLCAKYKALDQAERYDLVQKARLCRNCLKPGRHFAKECNGPHCTSPGCKGKHHVTLHREWKNNQVPTINQTSVTCAATGVTAGGKCFVGIIPVRVLSKHGQSCLTYALLDNGSDKTLCDQRLLRDLDITGIPVEYDISTVVMGSSRNYGEQVDFAVQAVKGGPKIDLKSVWSVKKLPLYKSSSASADDVKKWPHLSNIDIPEIESSRVTLLIGTDAPAAHFPLEFRRGGVDEPYATRTELGWAIRGPSHGQASPNTVNINFQQTSDAVLHTNLERMWQTDFSDKIEYQKSEPSVEDKEALRLMENSLTVVDGHYQISLPWRNKTLPLNNNVRQAETRLSQLSKKLQKDEKLRIMYTAAVTDYIDKGHARPVTEADEQSNRVWYLPHHPVQNPNKPNKVRVVFDCAAKYAGASLNDRLLQGPDLVNSLVGVLIRFRQDKIALTSDIEQMFHQVKVPEADQNALRFLWWPDGNLERDPVSYCMTVHLFGSTSSPSCTSFALKRTAADSTHPNRAAVSETINKNIYVDDCLKSVSTHEEALQHVNDSQAVLKEKGFNLTKWMSNDKSILSAIPEGNRAPSVRSFDLDNNALPCDRALGNQWNAESDSIEYKVNLTPQPETRRGILSMVSSLFDPCGLVAPVTLKPKILLQNLCRESLDWDDQIPDVYKQQWGAWLSELHKLSHLSIRRCFTPEGLNTIRDAQLHIFCDASENGYGAAVYLRITDVSGQVHTSLVIGKSRLAPIQQMSIPRLELSAAVVGSRLKQMVSHELDINISKYVFWTDSTIVLSYIRNKSRRFKTFVANRLTVIQSCSSPDEWNHVPSKLNPADLASRGIDASDADNLRVWLSGPDFLLLGEEGWPDQTAIDKITVSDDDVETKRHANVNQTIACQTLGLVDRYSDWIKLRRAVAWMVRFRAYCVKRYLKRDVNLPTGNLTVKEIQESTEIVLNLVQQQQFSDEMSKIKSGQPVLLKSDLSGLNPVIKDGILRVNSRIKSVKQPIILPDKHHVTRLLIRHTHEINGHVGLHQVLAALRCDYWIIKGISAVKTVLADCFDCKRRQGRFCSQQMAPLPEERITPDKPPFTYIGVDYFGPLYVKQGRGQAKRYGCLFTCLTTRAVHLEISHSLTTDSFLLAFSRFSSRRGVPEKVFSDNGTNFTSGDRELREGIEAWNQSKIEKAMMQREIAWHFNPPSASHMGGVWERMIRFTRQILKALIKERLLTDEALISFMTEAEKIINSRPITATSSDAHDPEPLTPSQLLLLKPNECLPPGLFDRNDEYSIRWWRQIHYLANQFWRRWIKEYLPALQIREKWQRPHRNVKVDDIVLVSDTSLPRGQWPIGRVLDVTVGRDGYVRSCTVKCGHSKVVRPIVKICLLEGSP